MWWGRPAGGMLQESPSPGCSAMQAGQAAAEAGASPLQGTRAHWRAGRIQRPAPRSTIECRL